MSAACIDVSRGTAYGLSMSQLALSLGSALFFPYARVEVFGARAVLVNGTLPVDPVLQGRFYGVGLAPLLLFSSAGTVWFSFITMSLQDKGCLSSDYTPEALESAQGWDFAFWTVFALGHAIMGLALAHPCDASVVALGVLNMVYFAQRICAPRAGGGSQTQGNLNGLGYVGGAALVCANIPGTPGAPRFLCLLFFMALDGVLGMGHTWEPLATMDTVTNCRLFYVCALSLGLCLMYSLWDGVLRVPT